MVQKLLPLCLILIACSDSPKNHESGYFEYCAGQYISINSDSTLPFTIKVREDLADGVWIGRYPNERWLLFKGKVQSGQRIGKWETFWPNGQVCCEVHYQYGLLHGSWKAFSENGRLLISGQLQHDQYSGLWKQYDSLGEVIASVKHSSKTAHILEFNALEMAKTMDTTLKNDISIHYSQKAGYDFGMETVPNNVPINFARTVSGLSCSFHKGTGFGSIAEYVEWTSVKAPIFRELNL